MPNKYRQETDVHLIPYHEYDPSIHNIEYRYLQQPVEESLGFPNTYGTFAAEPQDFYRRPVYRPRPFYPGGAFFHPPMYGGYGYHPYGGFPLGGYGYHHGGYPYGGYGYYHHDSPSFSR